MKKQATPSCALVCSFQLELSDIDLIEINKAFAAQVLACVRELGIDEERLIVNGRGRPARPRVARR